MTYLLDANLLIAMLDEQHVHHHRAHQWAGRQTGHLKWATCPLTENAFVRITSNPSYSNPFDSAQEALEVLRENCAASEHVFWPDDVSFCQSSVWAGSPLLSSRHLTDLYLLAVAVKHGGKLATLDESIPARHIRRGSEALHVLPAGT